MGIYTALVQHPPNVTLQFRHVARSGLGLDLDTMIGPMHAAGGWSEAGRLHFYITIGQVFEYLRLPERC